ncbi:MAG TPA: NAD-dependent epimerase/dehydratase family protein [Vicinamibacteria bacterium]|nr:NAD-dependent epimerase/dehydratase family protein [Vicinamibacteria bacterium]
MADRVVITGANGFVGRHVVAAAARRGLQAVGVVRSPAGAAAVKAAGGRALAVARLSSPELRSASQGARAIIHLAMIGSERPGITYTAVNVEGTRSIARIAVESGATPLVLFSGLGVARYGQAPRTTNRYFLSKLEAELEVYRSGVPAVVFRPSSILGPGDGLTTALLKDLAAGVVEVPGDGRYRMQPISVADAAEAVLSAALDPPQPVGRSAHRVIDLVGPEPIAYGRYVERFADVARAYGHAADFVVRHIPVAEADRQAVAGGYRGMLPDELDCLLCDEVSDAAPLQELLGRPVRPLDDAIAAAVDDVPHPQ